MANISQKVSDRLVAGIKKFKPVLTTAHENKVNESETVRIITAMLTEIFGYDTFSEITSEKNIRGTFCDLATLLDKKIQSLIEAKPIFHELNDANVTQAVGYASTEGVEWVVLTNGILWHVYKVTFAKPIDREKIVEIDFLNLDHRNPEDMESLFRLTKEGWMKAALDDYYEQKKALSKFSIAAILSTDSVLSLIRKNLKLISPDAKISAEQIRVVLEQEVIIKEILVGNEADEAHKKVAKALKKMEKASANQGINVPLQPVQQPVPPIWPPDLSASSFSAPTN